DNALPNENYSPTSMSGFVLPAFQNGAVSFYVKPRFHPTATQPAITLFYAPFCVKDEETYNRCFNPPPFGLAMSMTEASLRCYFVGSFRLAWGCLAPDGLNRGTYNTTPYGGDPLGWPYVPPFGTYLGQGGIAPTPFWFSNMNGLRDMSSGAMGRLCAPTMPLNGTAAFNLVVPNGDGIEGHWPMKNPFPNENLLFEFMITKYGFTDEHSYLGDPTRGFNPTWGTWTNAAPNSDEVTNIMKFSSYDNKTVLGMPLQLFDTSDTAEHEYHTVRKVFVLDRPIIPNPGALQGTGPCNSQGDYQAILETGRWNHVFLAWRDLHTLLGSTPPKKGGCLAVYVNGTFKQSMAGSFSLNSLFFHYDSSHAYAMDPMDTTTWGPLNKHNYYQTLVRLPTFEQRTLYLPSYGDNAASNLQTLPYEFGGCPVLPPVSSLFRPKTHNFRFDSVTGRGSNSVRKIPIYKRFPPRFYFGFEPHCYQWTPATPGADPETWPVSDPIIADKAPYYAANVAWASFMDIQIFDMPKQSTTDSPLTGGNDLGFRPNLPNFTNLSPYPGGSSGTPLNMHPLLQTGERVAGMKLARVSWSAYLPEFHMFWDNQDGTPAISLLDIQELSLFVSYRDPGTGVMSSVGSMKINQLPGIAPQWQWIDTTPRIVDSKDDIRLTLSFKGPPVVYATPLVESATTTLLLPESRLGPLLFE
ncbi:MAG: hypothetical protein AB7F75_11985, partial [Planctomycetota bacterium]